MDSSRRLRIVLIVVAVVGVIGFAGYQLLNAPERRLYALDALTGQVRWSATLPDDGPAPSTVAIGGDRVFIGVTARRGAPDQLSLLALDTQTGKQLWEHKFDAVQVGEPNVYTWAIGPRVLGDTVFVTLDGNDRENFPSLVALNASDGGLKWIFRWPVTIQGQYTPEVIQAGAYLAALVIARDTPPYLAFLDPETGNQVRELWRSRADSEDGITPFYAPYLQHNERAFFVNTHDYVYAFDPQTGKQRLRLGKMPTARYTLSGSALIAQSSSDISAYDSATGETQWQSKIEQHPQCNRYFTALNADAQAAYAFCLSEAQTDNGRVSTGWLLALDAQTGAQRWTGEFTQEEMLILFHQPHPAGEVVIVAGGPSSESLAVYAFAARDGAERWRFPVNTPYLQNLATDGRLVFVTDYAPRATHWLRR